MDEAPRASGSDFVVIATKQLSGIACFLINWGLAQNQESSV